MKGALYNLNSGDIYSIAETLKKVLRLTEKGTDLDQLPSNSIIREALNNLSKKRLGFYSDSNKPPEKIKIHSPKPHLRMMWLALNSNCNLQCEHCYATSSPGPFDGTLDINVLFRSMEEAKKLFDLECIQLIGGEPLLLGKTKVTRILNEAKRLNIPMIEIFTNGHLIDDFYVDYFMKNDIRLAISIYSSEAQEHDAVTNVVGSWLKTMSAIRKVTEVGIKVRFGIVATTMNQRTVSSTAAWLKEEFGVFKGKKFDVVRSCGRGNNSNIIPWELFRSQHMKLKPDFSPVTVSRLERTMFNNICWGEQICVMPNGDITPCEMEFENIEGNITHNSLAEILLGEGGDFSQKLNKDKIDICKDCEYRYACWECRAMAHQLDIKKFSKPLTCTYDPYTGEWKNPPDNLKLLFPKFNKDRKDKK